MVRTFFMVKGGTQGRLKYEGGARTKRRPYFLGNLIENTTESIDRPPKTYLETL